MRNLQFTRMRGFFAADMHQIITAQSIDIERSDDERENTLIRFALLLLICSLPVYGCKVVSCYCSMGCEIWHLIENYFLFFHFCLNIEYITSTVIICFNQRQQHRLENMFKLSPLFRFDVKEKIYILKMKLTLLDDGRNMKNNLR